MYIFSCVPQESLWVYVYLWVVGVYIGPQKPLPMCVYLWVVGEHIGPQDPKSQEPIPGVALMCLNQPEHLRCGCSCFHEHFWCLAKEERGKAARDLQAFSFLILKHMEGTFEFCDLHVMPEIAATSLGLLGWAGKAWEQQPTQQSWGAHLVGATVPVICLGLNAFFRRFYSFLATQSPMLR